MECDCLLISVRLLSCPSSSCLAADQVSASTLATSSCFFSSLLVSIMPCKLAISCLKYICSSLICLDLMASSFSIWQSMDEQLLIQLTISAGPFDDRMRLSSQCKGADVLLCQAINGQQYNSHCASYQFNSSRYSLTWAAVSTWNLLSSRTTPTSMLALFISPSQFYFSVSSAVWMASSISMSALYLFSKNTLAFLDPFPIAVAFQLQQAPEGSI